MPALLWTVEEYSHAIEDLSEGLRVLELHGLQLHCMPYLGLSVRV